VIATNEKPLTGLRVLDFTRVLAGPYCTALLADLGADVVKVEPPHGDDYRHIGPFFPDGSSALFEAVNRSKRGIVLDLSRDSDRDVALRLARRADVLVENFRPSVATKLGIGYPAMAAVNPRLVYASISGFGQDGPNTARPAYDFILQAMTGIMAVTGDPDASPMPVGEAIADVSAGLFASWAILAALVERQRTGCGRYIDVGMFDAMIAMQPIIVARLVATGKAPQRVGNKHALSAPFGVFRAVDGEFVLTVLNEKLFAALAATIGRPEIASDPRFATDSDRRTHEAELRAIIESWSSQRNLADVVTLLMAAGVPASDVQDIGQALASDQVRTRPVLQSVTHPTLDVLLVPEQPARFAGVVRGSGRAAPRLGEHTDAVLAEIERVDP
jgi:CoA:oxalate CoA-transferase